MSMQLVRYDAMCHAIAEAYAVDEVKDIRDRAIAIAAYARQVGNRDAEDKCARIRLRAERKAGELLRDMEKAKAPPGPGRGNKRASSDTTPFSQSPTLADLGVTRDQASQWQQIAKVSQPEFETYVATQHMPTGAGLLYAVNPPPKPIPVSKDALWLWGQLQEFKRDALHRDPGEFYETMVDTMLADVAELLPRVIAWLEQARELCPEVVEIRYSQSSPGSSKPATPRRGSAPAG